MKTQNRRTIIGFIVIAILLVFVIPISINEAYKVNCGYSTKWGASDVLSFYGTLLASVIGILGVFFSIRYAQENYRQDIINRSLPFLTITHLGKKTVDPFLKGFYFDELEECKNAPQPHEELVYQEYLRNHWFFSIQKSNEKITISLKERLSAQDEEFRDYSIGDIAEFDNFSHTVESGSVYMPLIVRNAGNGCAINVIASLSNAESGLRLASIPIPLSVNETLYLAIMSKDISGIMGKYILSFQYADILGNQYTQAGTLTIVATPENKISISGLDTFPQCRKS